MSTKGNQPIKDMSKRILSQLQLTLVLVIVVNLFASCNDSICYDNIKWDLIGHFDEKEFGVDEDGDPFFFASSNRTDLSFYIVFCGISDKGKRVDDYSSIQDGFLKNLSERHTIIFEPKESRNYSTGAAQVIRRRWKVIDLHLKGISELVLIDRKLFLTYVFYGMSTNHNNKSRSEKILESIRVISDSAENNNSTGRGQSSPSEIRVLELCSFIPDHGLNPQAKEYMTYDFYSALSNAFAYERRYSDSEIGPGEFLYYFVTGNGGSKPYYEVLSISVTEPDHAVAMIGVKDLWEEQTKPSPDAEQRVYIMHLVCEEGKWLMDDFDNKKQECKLLVRSL